MAEKRERKVKEIKVRLEQMNFMVKGVTDSLDELTLETEELDKEMRKRLREQFK